MRRNQTIASALLVVAGGLSNIFAAAFTPSTAVHDAHTKPTSQSYTNGDVPSPYVLPWDPQPETSQVHDPFEVWGKLRLGLGTGPGSNSNGVFWVGEGALYEAYSGRKLAIFEGFDVGRGVQISDTHIRQLSRKIFWFRDPETGEILTEYNGEPVRPIVYDGQAIDYRRLEDGSITYSVQVSKRPLKGALPKMAVSSQMAGPRQMMMNVPVFIDIPVAEERGGGRYQAWEFYDYVFDPSFPADRPPTAVWTRQGSMPPFIKDSQAVLKFSGYRADSYEELPHRMRMEVEREYPLFQKPPKDEKEVFGSQR